MNKILLCRDRIQESRNRQIEIRASLPSNGIDLYLSPENEREFNRHSRRIARLQNLRDKYLKEELPKPKPKLKRQKQIIRNKKTGEIILIKIRGGLVSVTLGTSMPTEQTIEIDNKEISVTFGV